MSRSSRAEATSSRHERLPTELRGPRDPTGVSNQSQVTAAPLTPLGVLVTVGGDAGAKSSEAQRYLAGGRLAPSGLYQAEFSAEASRFK